MTWKGFAGVMITLGTTFVAMDWYNSKEMNERIESRVSTHEFERHVQAQNRWQDRMEAKMDSVTRSADASEPPTNAEASAIVQIYPRVEELRNVAVEMDARLTRVQQILEKQNAR